MGIVELEEAALDLIRDGRHSELRKRADDVELRCRDAGGLLRAAVTRRLDAVLALRLAPPAVLEVLRDRPRRSVTDALARGEALSAWRYDSADAPLCVRRAAASASPLQSVPLGFPDLPAETASLREMLSRRDSSADLSIDECGAPDALRTYGDALLETAVSARRGSDDRTDGRRELRRRCLAAKTDAVTALRAVARVAATARPSRSRDLAVSAALEAVLSGDVAAVQSALADLPAALTPPAAPAAPAADDSAAAAAAAAADLLEARARISAAEARLFPDDPPSRIDDDLDAREAEEAEALLWYAGRDRAGAGL